MAYQKAFKYAIAVLLFVGSVQPQRWSRQVQSTGFTGGLSDWVPVQFPGQPQSSDRQTGARVLNFAPPAIQQTNSGQHTQQQIHQHQPQPQQQQQPHHQHHHQQQSPYIPQQIFHQPQPQQINFNGAGEPFQLIPANQQRFQLQQQSPSVQYQMVPPAKHIIGSTPHLFGQQPPPQQQQIQSPPPSQNLPHFHYTQLQPSPSAFPPHQQQQPQPLQHQPQPQFVQERPQQLPQQVHALQLSPAEINQQYQFPQYIEQEPQVQTQPQQIQHVLQQQFEVPQAPSFVQQNSINGRPQTQPLIQRTPQLYGQEPEPIIRNSPPHPNQVADPEEEVQLLYVPLETLNQQNPHRVPHPPKPQPPTQNNKYNVQPVNPQQINHFYTSTPANTPSAYSPTTPSPYASSPAYTFGSTVRFNQSPATTPKPKPKSHQPPLAMFMLNDIGQSQISVNDVLKALKNAKNIDVLDSATKQSPKVFVGPSGLRTPNGYSKFELPYLSSIEQNRAERQVNKLPFFVAPLSYKAPNGFAKIPLPAPHVGSVVINSPPEVIEYQSVNLQVPQRTQTYPKKVQSQTSPTLEQTTSVFRQTPKYISGFKFGSDVFTTTAKPAAYYSPSSTREPSNEQQYNFVSTTPAYRNREQFSHSPSTEANYQPFVSSTQQPQRHQETFTKTKADDLFSMFVSSTQKPQHQQFEQFERRPQLSQTTTRSAAYQAFTASTTPSPIRNNNRFEQPTYQSARPVSSTQAPLSTYSSQQHEEEYSNFGDFGKYSAPHRTPSTPSPKLNSFDDSFFNLKSNPSSSVQSEEYFNVKKPQTVSFAPKNESKFEQYNQFNPSNDYLSTSPVVKNETKLEQYNQYKSSNDYYITPPVTSSASSASAPKPTESEHYSFQPIIGHSPSTARPDSTYTSKPTDFSTRAQEILKMKNYFREQNAQKSRPSQDFAPSSTPSYDYQSSSTEAVTTESNFIETKPTTSVPRKITYYTPSPHFVEETDKPVQHFKYVDPVNGQRSTESYKNSDYKFPVSSSSEKSIYSNHRDTYQESSPVAYKPRQKEVTSTEYEQTESPYNVYTKSQETKNQYRPNVEINNAPDDDANTYNLPSELPPISAHLPGLVNSLYVEQTEDEPITTTPAATTRRTINRGRRPQSQTTRAAVSRVPVTRPPRTTTTTSANTFGTDSDEYSTRRTTVRGRRPIHYANRTTTLRTPTARNPNRVRYNPTAEERQRSRTKQSKVKDEDLEYQRDVLNQNYPVITKPTSTEIPSTTESRYTTAVSYAHETERYSSNYRADSNQESTYDIPANHSPTPRDFLLTTPRTLFNELPSHFSGLEDHMQIPQEHQALHGAFYNSESDVSAAEAINGQGIATNHPVFLTSSPTNSPTSTTDEVTVFDNLVESQPRKRPNFVKRPVGGRSAIVTSTAAPSPTVTQSNFRGSSRERFTIRPFTKQDAATVGYTPKPRNGRLRTRPTTTLSPPTTTRDPEVQTYVDDNYHQISRFNKDFYQDAPSRTKNTPQRNQPKGVRVSPANEQKRYKYDRFALDAQESQWSTKVSQNSFIPVDPESAKSGKSLKKEYEFNSADEPEIVTAGSLLDNETEPDSFMLKVGSSFAGSPTNSNETNITPSTPSETSFVDLLEKAMSDIGNEISKKQPEEAGTTTIAPSKSETATDTPTTTQLPKRRGVWKRVRVRPVDAFETAESQNYGHRVFNGLPDELSKESPKKSLSVFPVPTTTDDVDESETPRRDEPVPTPTNDDVSPTISEAAAPLSNQTLEEAITTTTTEEPLITMVQVERLEEREEEQSPVSTTTVTSTRRYDRSEDDLIMEESDDHTEFPFSFDGVNDEVDDVKTDSPITERSFYDDYDSSDFKTESTRIASDLAQPNASPSSSMMSEVKQKLAELFSFSDDYEDDNNVRSKPVPAVYTTIDRSKSADIIENESTTESEAVDAATTESSISIPVTTTLAPSKSFHKKLMESVIYATSTSTEISHETEICYRGRCIKSDKKP